ncbi:peptidylprolyl isomerase, partial [Spirochaetota bacterium]
MKLIKQLIILFLLSSSILISEIIEQIYVVVNDDIITMLDYETEIDNYKNQMKRSGQKVEKNYTYLILTNMINNYLIKQDAKDKGISVTDDDVNAQINHIMRLNNITDKEQFKIVVEAQGMKYDDFFEKQKYGLYYQNLLYRVITVNEPTFEEIKEYYNHNKKKFKLGKALIRASHILIKKDKGMPFKEIMDKKKIADNIAEQIKGGLSFDEAAKKHSEDEISKNVKGDLGFIEGDDMPDEFMAEIKKLKKDEISKVISTRIGFHIIKVT